MTAAEWIAKRRELLDAATEGPWELRSYMDREYSVYAPRWPGIVAELGIGAEDTALIADARTSLPRALDALEAALELAKGHRDWVTKRGRDDCICTICDMCRAIESALRAES